MFDVFGTVVDWRGSIIAEGRARLKKRYVVATLSNGNVALLVNMAKHGGLPWDCVLSAELFHHYNPDPWACGRELSGENLPCVGGWDRLLSN